MRIGGAVDRARGKSRAGRVKTASMMASTYTGLESRLALECDHESVERFPVSFLSFEFANEHL